MYTRILFLIALLMISCKARKAILPLDSSNIDKLKLKLIITEFLWKKI